MRKARVFMHGVFAGVLSEYEPGKSYLFSYDSEYSGPPVSLTMPLVLKEFKFGSFPSFFDGLLPEGAMLESLLRLRKIDRNDLLSQLIAVGNDLVGAVTVEEIS